MEEKKKAMEKKMHVVTSKDKQNTEQGKQPLTYEQLNDVCQQLFQQNQQLREKVSELGNITMFKRLDYLFKVVENAHAFNEEFVAKCVDEIEDLMTVPEAEEETGDKPEE